MTSCRVLQAYKEDALKVQSSDAENYMFEASTF
jgi:hypothetical protein